MPNKIVDEFTDLPVSRQRKHQLRNPEWAAGLRRKWDISEKGKAKIRIKSLRQRKRNLEYYREYGKQYYIRINL